MKWLNGAAVFSATFWLSTNKVVLTSGRGAPIRKFHNYFDMLLVGKESAGFGSMLIRRLADDLLRRRNQDGVRRLDIQRKRQGRRRDCLPVQVGLRRQGMVHRM